MVPFEMRYPSLTSSSPTPQEKGHLPGDDCQPEHSGLRLLLQGRRRPARREYSTTLLLFDEILKKGFDGHNFIVGLSEHLRDLLVVKDEATVELLQVSESVKDRYLEQTARASVSFLLSALNLANQCDIHYKTSKTNVFMWN